MKKYKSGWEKAKFKKEEEKRYKKVLAVTKKITEFCQPKNITEPESIIELGTSSATATETDDHDQAIGMDILDSSTTNRNHEQEEPGRSAGLVEEVKVEMQCDKLPDVDTEFPDDVGMWKVTDVLREYFCFKGIASCQHIESDFSASEDIFPGDTFKRRCSKSLFFRVQLNGEKVQRDWLCYSPKTGKIFCANCKLFPKDEETSLLATSGYYNYRHEVSTLHRNNIEKVISIKTTGKRIDKSLVEQHMSERNYWRQLLKRILSVIKFLSSRGFSWKMMRLLDQ